MAKKLAKEDLSALSSKDLVLKVAAVKVELQKMRFNHVTTPLTNTNLIGAKKRDIARLMTEINARKNKNS